MKIEKRILPLVLVLVLVLAALCLVSCAEKRNIDSSGTAKLIVENSENDYTVYEVDLAKLEKRTGGAMTVLEYVAMQEGSTLYYNVQWGGGYGAYITAIGTLNPKASSEYISIYTSEEADFAIPTEYMPTVMTVNYNENTLSYAGVGLSSMHIKDGTVILFRLEKF